MAARSSSYAPKRLLNLFLCHASGDKQHVRTLYNLLASDGVNPWLDEREILPGQDWEFEIRRALRNADIVVVCLSTRSVTKEGYVQKEIALAIDVGLEKPEGTIFLVPVRLDDCTVPERLRRWQWVDFYADGGYKKLIASCTYRARQLGLELQNVAPKTRPRRSKSIQMSRPLVQSASAAIHPLTPGEAVRIITGPLAGMTGEVSRVKNLSRVVLTIPLIRQSVAVEVDVSEVVPAGSKD